MVDITKSNAAEENKVVVGKHHEKFVKTLQLVEATPIVKFMVEQMEKIGCPFPIATKVECRECDKAVGGRYEKENHKIILCENQLPINVKEIKTTLVHEMIHAYDNCTAQLDYDNCLHHACTEVID